MVHTTKTKSGSASRRRRDPGTNTLASRSSAMRARFIGRGSYHEPSAQRHAPMTSSPARGPPCPQNGAGVSDAGVYKSPVGWSMSARGAFVIPIHDLDVDGRDVEFSITPAWLRGALEGCEAQPAGPEGSLHVHLTKTGNEVLVQGQIDVHLVVPCARCLRSVELRPHVELSLLLFPAPSAAKARNGA